MEFEETINSFVEYISIVSEIAKPYNGRLYIGQKLLYRGHSDKKYQLLPSVARKKNIPTQVSLLDYERNLIEEAKYRMPSVFRDELQPIDLLAILQHYGIPTRLLDVTSSPLVALYFACCSHKEYDGEVVIFERIIEDNAIYPINNAIADSYKLAAKGTSYLSTFYERMLCQSYSSEQITTLNLSYDTSQKGAEWIKNCCDKIMFVQAKRLAERQLLQQGEYILFPNSIVTDNDCLQFENMINPIDKNSDKIYGRIYISSSAKEEIIKELNTFGINKGTLFADSIETVCGQIVEDIKKMI